MQSKTFALKSIPAGKSVRNPGSIQRVPITEALAATMFMPIAVILVVGMDLSFSTSEIHVWQSAGYHVAPAASLRDAMDHIRYGDFDVVLMGDSISSGDKQRLTLFIRALGLRVPVVCVTDSASVCPAFADAIISKEPFRLLHCIGELLAAQAGKPAQDRATAAGRLLRA